MASKRKIRRKSCQNKIKYAHDDAVARAQHSRMNAYKCKFCNGWHLGHVSRAFQYGKKN